MRDVFYKFLTMLNIDKFPLLYVQRRSQDFHFCGAMHSIFITTVDDLSSHHPQYTCYHPELTTRTFPA